MVNLRANHHHEQQCQPLSPQRHQKTDDRASVVANENDWNYRRSSNNIEYDDDDRVRTIVDDLPISKTVTDNFKNDDRNSENRDNRVWQLSTIPEGSLRLETSVSNRDNFETLGNDRSYECRNGIENENDIEDVDDELEEKEEDNNYAIEEVETESENDDDDCDNDDVEAGRSDRWIQKKVSTTRIHRQTSFGTNDEQTDVVPHLDETSFGEVCITNSKHVHVGNTNFYKGPVTIKQFVYTNAYPVLDKDDVEGSSNPRSSDGNSNGSPISKRDSNGPILNDDRECDKVTKCLWTWRFAALSCFLALTSVTIVTVLMILSTPNHVAPPIIPDSPNSGSDEIEVPSSSVRIIDRQFWNAQPPSKELDKLKVTPTPYVIISHTATEPCLTQSTCVLRVRLIQTLHIESFKWDDIGYNFLVGGDGLAYRGRGWNLAGSHAHGYNYNSIGISFIGTFNDRKPNELQLRAAQNLIELGIERGKISQDYKLLGHRQVSKTLSPGDRLYEILQTWKHWSPVPKPVSDEATIFD